ncbi:PAS domain S-box-containing protein [Krasilnikovia cinnamomea]|uniref:histidine kinase n=2 Tax=Krasilnikovia cinnamomea TaxID=349313 RepID=A0A4Q7ZLA8_9ACTN|nr:PAS domain S-box-containing protein [Krasilnikovia cinnamomea]
MVATSGLAIFSLSAEPHLLSFGFIALGPCFAAVSGSPTVVALIGTYATTLVIVVSSYQGLWGTPDQVLRIAVTLVATAICVVIASHRRLLEFNSAEAVKDQVMLAAVLEASSDAVYTATPEGTITTWNRGAEEIYGYTRAAAIGSSIQMLAPPDDGTALLAMFAEAAQGRRSDQIEVTRVRHDGTPFDVSVMLAPVRDPAGNVTAVASIEHDITARKRAGAKERAALERTQTAQRLESLGQLAGGIAHDFNNLLAIILNYSQFAAEQIPTDSEARDDLARVLRAAERARRLTHQLLVFARSERTEPAIIDLNDVVAEANDLFSRTLGGHIQLVTRTGEQPTTIIADRSSIDQVLFNLVINARDAMPDGGVLVMEVDHVEISSDEVGYAPPPLSGRYIRLTVNDTGTGMAPEVVNRVFEPFFTTKAKHEGTGLGLATVYGIVTDAGGSIRIASELHVGTTFSVLFPAAEVSDQPTATVADRPTAHGNGERVLVVDDDETVRELMVRILDRNGYKPVPAADPEGALKLADEPFDLLLTDVLMPQMSGPELAQRIKDRQPDIPVLFVSGYTDGNAGVGRATGGILLHKPFTTDSLLDSVQEALAGTGVPSR